MTVKMLLLVISLNGHIDHIQYFYTMTQCIYIAETEYKNKTTICIDIGKNIL